MNKCASISEIPEILYHGTTNLALPSLEKGIDLKKGREEVDFGQGFYLTASKEQATRWAEFKVGLANRRNSRSQAKGVIVCYSVNKGLLADAKLISFDDFTVEWALFVLFHRTGIGKGSLSTWGGGQITHPADIVFGPLADGTNLSTLIYEYQKNIINLQQFTAKITGSKYGFPEEHQFSFHTEKAKASLKIKGVETL